MKYAHIFKSRKVIKLYITSDQSLQTIEHYFLFDKVADAKKKAKELGAIPHNY